MENVREPYVAGAFYPDDEESLLSVIGPYIENKPEDFDYKKIDDITLGKHGLYIKNSIYSGILLPQVAVEYNLTKKEFLEETCLKAGLNRNCYINSELYVFEGKIIK